LEDESDNRYDGREHSFIKHLFLAEYLKSAAFKTLQRRSVIFNYVDGFAGPWKVADAEDYSDSSFDLSIRTLLSVKDALEAKGQSAIIRFCLCEHDRARARRLRDYAQRQEAVDIHVFEGVFEDRLDDIAAIGRDGFTFTFIDPTGFNLRSQDIANFLVQQQGDFLFNYMSEHINRYPAVEAVQRAFGNLLADTNWRSRFDALSSELRNEERVLVLFKERMKELKGAQFMPDFAILNPRRNRVQMRLVLGTNHPSGVEVFRDVQARVEQTQDAIRDRIRNPQQASLFSAPSSHVVGGAAACSDASRTILEIVQPGKGIDFSKLVGPVLEVAAIRVTDLKRILGEMRKIGMVAFDLPQGKIKPDHGIIIRRP